jgi:hypothetical protein
MLNREFIIREFTEKDISGILDLFSLSFGKEASQAWFLWKYQKSPWSARGYVVLHKEDIVAFYGGLRLQFISGEEMLWAYQFCDVMTHPKYRGKIFGKNPVIIRVARLFQEENAMDFAFGFPSERHARLQTMMMGATSYKHIIGFRKPLHSKRTSALYPYRMAVGWEHLSEKDMDVLWEKSSKRLSFALVKNSRFLVWRYREHPDVKYLAIVMKRLLSRKPRAFAVAKVTGNELHVLDFLIAEKELYSHFWAMIESVSCDLKATSIITWANVRDPLSAYLTQSGYEAFQGIPYGVRIVSDEKLSEQMFYETYSYRMGDYDAS